MLRGLGHDLLVAPRTAELLAEAALAEPDLNAWQVANLGAIRRIHAHGAAVPHDLVVADSKATSRAEMAWRDARAARDFAALLPHLKEVLGLQRATSMDLQALTGMSRRRTISEGTMKTETMTAAVTIPDLAGKAVLITGASTGIGAALARAFAEQGARIAIHYNASRDEAARLAEGIAAGGGTAALVQGDVSRDGETERVVEEAAGKLGGLDGLINNAGGMLGRVPTDQMTDDHYRRVMDLNARSVLAATRAAHPFLKRQGGFIINTTSIAARNGGGNGAILYAASKGFVSTITRGHAKEFVGDRIRVNAVAPGVIATPFHDRYTSPEQLELQRKTIPMGFVGTPDHCIGAYLFLASEALSGYVTGQIIEVNGGQLMP